MPDPMSRQTSVTDAGVGLVAAVDADQVGGERLDLVGVAQPAAVHAADAGDDAGEVLDQVGGLAVSLAEHEHVGVDLGRPRGPRACTAQTLWKAPTTVRVGQQRGGLLGGRALLDRRARRRPACRSRAGSRSRRRPCRRARWRAPRAGRRGRPTGTATTTTSPAAAAPALSAPVTSPPVASASVRRGVAGALGAAAADHHRQPGGGEPAGQPAALRSGAAEHGDGGGAQ